MKQALTLYVIATLTLSTSAFSASYSGCSDKGCNVRAEVTPKTDYAAVQYPIVLTHGIFGYDQLAGSSMWYQIPEDLVQQGANVYVTQVSPLNSTDVRGEQLLKQIQNILAISGAKKVNLIGHSQGGLSVRYVLGVAPDLIASATTVGSPHKGTKVADVAQYVADDNIPVVSPIFRAGAKALGTLVNWATGNTSSVADIRAMTSEMTIANSAKFTAKFPAGVPSSTCGEGVYSHQGIPLFSWGGTSVSTNWLDPSDIQLLMTSAIVGETPNDGMIGKCSTHFGKVLRDDYKQNHNDEINQTNGLVNKSAEPKAIFRQHANRLKNMGL